MTWSVATTGTSTLNEAHGVTAETLLLGSLISNDQQQIPLLTKFTDNFERTSSISQPTELSAVQQNNSKRHSRNNWQLNNPSYLTSSPTGPCFSLSSLSSTASMTMSSLHQEKHLLDIPHAFPHESIWEDDVLNSKKPLFVQTSMDNSTFNSHSSEASNNIFSGFDKNNASRINPNGTDISSLQSKQKTRSFTSSKSKAFYQQKQLSQALSNYRPLTSLTTYHSSKSASKTHDNSAPDTGTNDPNPSFEFHDTKKDRKPSSQPTNTIQIDTHHGLLVYDKQGRGPLSIFVGNIPFSVTLETFYKQMQLRGKVIDVAYGFREGAWMTAFVTFSKTTEAAQAIEALNNRRIFKNTPPHRLVSCFAPHPPPSLLCGLSNQQGIKKKEDGLKNKTSWNLEPFYPKFDDQPDALKRNSVQPRFSLLRDGPPGANLFVYGIPSDWTEVTLMRLCQEFGHIVGIRVPSASGSQRLNKGFGFVSYDSTESSSRAFTALSGREVFGKSLIVQVKSGEQLPRVTASLNQEIHLNENSTKRNYQRKKTCYKKEDVSRDHTPSTTLVGEKETSPKDDESLEQLCFRVNKMIPETTSDMIHNPPKSLSFSNTQRSSCADFRSEHPTSFSHHSSTPRETLASSLSLSDVHPCESVDPIPNSAVWTEPFLTSQPNLFLKSFSPSQYHSPVVSGYDVLQYSMDHASVIGSLPCSSLYKTTDSPTLHHSTTDQLHGCNTQVCHYDISEKSREWKKIGQSLSTKDHSTCDNLPYQLTASSGELDETEKTLATLDPETPIPLKHGRFNSNCTLELQEKTPPKIVPSAFLLQSMRKGIPVAVATTPCGDDDDDVKSYHTVMKGCVEDEASTLHTTFESSKPGVVRSLPPEDQIENLDENSKEVTRNLSRSSRPQILEFSKNPLCHKLCDLASQNVNHFQYPTSSQCNKSFVSDHFSNLSNTGNMSLDSISNVLEMSRWHTSMDDHLNKNSCPKFNCKPYSPSNTTPGNPSRTSVPFSSESIISPQSDTISLFCHLVEQYLRIS